jgi:hypothetical protein
VIVSNGLEKYSILEKSQKGFGTYEGIRKKWAQKIFPNLSGIIIRYKNGDMPQLSWKRIFP